jgi:PAS domain S-box-containing protein
MRHVRTLATQTLVASAHGPEPGSATAPASNEAFFRRLVEDQSELVSLATPEGELTFVNRAYARWQGGQPHELLGRSLLEFVPAKHRAAVFEQLQTVLEREGSVEAECQMVLPDGKTRWIAWTHRGLTDAEGRVTAIHSVGRDIESRVAAERRLEASEARYRLLAERAPTWSSSSISTWCADMCPRPVAKYSVTIRKN